MKKLFILILLLSPFYLKAQSMYYMDANGRPKYKANMPKVDTTGDYNDLINIPGLTKILFINSAQKSVANTVTETTLVPTGIGSMFLTTIPVSGREWRVQIGGIYSVPAIVSGQLTIKVKYNSTVLATSTITNFLAGATNLSFDSNFKIVNLTIGTSGTCTISGALNYSNGNNSARIGLDINNGGSVITLNNSVAAQIEITATWDSASASKTVTVNQLSLEQLN